MKRLTVAAALLYACNLAAQEPLTFKGLAIGASQASFLEIVPNAECTPDRCTVLPGLKCRALKTAHEMIECGRPYFYGDVAPEYISARFDTGGLASVYLMIPERAFKRLVAAMTERFGEPDSDMTTEIQNRMGAKFDNRRVLWARGDAVLVATQRAGKIDNSSVSFLGKAAAAKQQHQNEQKAKEAAKNL